MPTQSASFVPAVFDEGRTKSRVLVKQLKTDYKLDAKGDDESYEYSSDDAEGDNNRDPSEEADGDDAKKEDSTEDAEGEDEDERCACDSDSDHSM